MWRRGRAGAGRRHRLRERGWPHRPGVRWRWRPPGCCATGPSGSRRRCRRHSRWSGVEPPRRGRDRGRTRCRGPPRHRATGWRRAGAERRGPCRWCCPTGGRRHRRRERARATARAEPLSPPPQQQRGRQRRSPPGAWGVEPIPEAVTAVWAGGSCHGGSSRAARSPGTSRGRGKGVAHRLMVPHATRQRFETARPPAAPRRRHGTTRAAPPDRWAIPAPTRAAPAPHLVAGAVKAYPIHMYENSRRQAVASRAH
jgi:hypothetical protein